MSRLLRVSSLERSDGTRELAESNRGVRVGLAASETAATIAGQGDDGTGAFTGLEAAASLLAIGVGGAGTSDELGALGRGGCGCGCSCSTVLNGGGTSLLGLECGHSTRELAERLRGVGVGHARTETAATIALEGDDGTGAFTGVESATSFRTVGVLGARASDELGALRSTGDDGRRREQSEVGQEEDTDHRERHYC